ncbi:hypothetical protein QFC24_002889 [Naganishia onofrii]|uniref:Uncharacterized protein n=1 Tax=Naganishia onofrii TaxID=1851511 RepID=A0ACC2XLV0_9TREE|nr:hypothetical protein QFC24_002889 [Naganishia onofrii]
MRLYSSFTALAAPLLAIASASTSHQKPIQIFLYPSPSTVESYQATHDRTPLLNADQAQAIFSHHLGVAGLSGGVDEYEKLPEGHGSWVHLLGTPGENEVQEANKGRVIIIQGDVEAEDILPNTISPNPTFYLSSTSSTVRAFLQPYINRAEQVVDHIMDSLDIKDSRVVQWLGDLRRSLMCPFGEKIETSKLLHDQLEALSALASRMPWNDKSQSQDSSWESIIINAFGGSSNAADGEDAQIQAAVRKAGCLGVKGALSEMTSSSDQPPFILVIMPSNGATSIHKTKRAFESETVLNEDLDFDSEDVDQQVSETTTAASYTNSSIPADANPMCFPSNRTCDYASSSCSGHGICVQVSNSTKESRTGECWKCKCAAGYVGVQCQKGDYVFQTILLVFTPLLLITVLLASVGLLNAVGGEKLPSTLTLSMGGPHKRD